MSVFILLIALILALAAGYFFLQWKCPSKKEKLEQTLENISETEKDLDFSELETPSQIKDLKTKLGEEIKKVKELQKKKTDKLTEEESKALANLPVLQEVQTLVQDVEKKADFDKKVYGTWDYAYAGGIVVGVFLVSVWLVGKLFGMMKLGEEK